MRHNTSKILASVAVFGVVAAGGSAFTASSSLPQTPKVVGYDTTTITGAVATDVSYQLSTDSSKIAQALITFTGDQTGRVIKAGWGEGTLDTTCTVPVTYVAPSMVATCDFGTTVDTGTATKFKVAVTS
jgi:hypothetical protein